MEQSTLDDMRRHITNPEKWLIDSGLMDVIKSDYYQTLLAYRFYFEREKNNGVVPSWSDAIKLAAAWLEGILSSNATDCKLKDWQ